MLFSGKPRCPGIRTFVILVSSALATLTGLPSPRWVAEPSFGEVLAVRCRCEQTNTPDLAALLGALHELPRELGFASHRTFQMRGSIEVQALLESDSLLCSVGARNEQRVERSLTTKGVPWKLLT